MAMYVWLLAQWLEYQGYITSIVFIFLFEDVHVMFYIKDSFRIKHAIILRPMASALLFQPQTVTPLKRHGPTEDLATCDQWHRHFYFSHRLSPLLSGTPRPNTLQGSTFLGQILISLVNISQK